MYVVTIQYLNYHGQGYTQSAVNVSDTPVTLKKVKVSKPGMKLVDPERGYNHFKFERPPFNSVHKRAYLKVFAISGNTSIILHMCETSRK